jgi:hypothetical protein
MGNKTHTLYGGAEVIDFKDSNHTYSHRIHGILPNATGVCKVMAKPKLIGWAARKSSEFWYNRIEPGVSYDEIELKAMLDQGKQAHDVFSGEARDIGKFIHEWCEHMALHEMGQMKAPKKPVNHFVLNGVKAWEKWAAKYPRREWMFAERVLFHNKDIHVGTADGGLYLDGGSGSYPTVLDYKTGSGVWAEAGLQAASYAHSARREFGDEWRDADRMVVHLNARTGGLSVWDEERIQGKLTGGTVDQDYECFLGLLKAYNWIMDGPNKWAFLSG